MFLNNRGFATEAIIIIVCLVAGVASFYLTKRADGPIEEIAEAIIKAKTGIDIDISP